ncbi:M15 family metallopeptidase [uncultured Martelella sp.]|uniref:M15 family metallopeptidase n=1 Tax=uncultured Martelella sp. TaxID=392331 RepID=UPI0029C8AF7B|nr:M15 family metallopeptidase [uncultured Martelella sp.]
MTDEQKFILWLEGRLTAHGFTPGAIDGVFDDTAKAALTAFQRARGISPSGKADVETVAALRLSSSRVSPADRDDIPDRDRPGAADARGGPWPLQRDCTKIFGDPQTQVPDRLVMVRMPWDCRAAWNPALRITRLRLHEKVADSAERCLDRASRTFDSDARHRLGLDLSGGSYAKRRMRGGSSWSMHAYGIAIDWDPQRNALRTHAPEARLSHDDARRWWEIWEDEGWVSLGRARDFDWMHVQAARI